MRKIFSDANISFTNSGRTSLFIILKALNLPEKAQIGVPLYSCPSVFDAIIHAGYTPVFIDIDINNYTLSPEDLQKKIDQIDALVVIHTFGRPADMDKILEIASDKPLIEDCAHALLSKCKGELVGTASTASFFTFRTGKYISAGEGGMIVTKDPNLGSRIEREIEVLPCPSIADEIKHCIITYAKSALYQRPWFGLIALPLGEKVENRFDIMNKRTFKLTQIRKTDLYITTKKMRCFEEKVNRQRKNSQYLINHLNDLNLKLPLELPTTYCNYFLFPVQFKTESQRDKIGVNLRKKGIDTTKLFSKTPDIATHHYGYKGNCQNAESIAERILTIPNFYVLRMKELNKIISVLKENLEEEGSFV
jgi:dTDP-4-amino-4,6-dideoxygalactose transaminase